jgi:hypothetical protein
LRSGGWTCPKTLSIADQVSRVIYPRLGIIEGRRAKGHIEVKLVGWVSGN